MNFSVTTVPTKEAARHSLGIDLSGLNARIDKKPDSLSVENAISERLETIMTRVDVIKNELKNEIAKNGVPTGTIAFFAMSSPACRIPERRMVPSSRERIIQPFSPPSARHLAKEMERRPLPCRICAANSYGDGITAAISIANGRLAAFREMPSETSPVNFVTQAHRIQTAS